MNENKSPVWEKATDTAQFLKENLNDKTPVELIALYQQIGIKEDSDESEMLTMAKEPEYYISLPGADRQKINDMVQSLRSAIEGEDNGE